MVIQIGTTTLKTKYGVYQEKLFYDGQKEAIALVMGDVTGEDDVLCRVHSSCLFAHAFNSIECDCREQMAVSQQLIQKEGKGIIIWLDQEGKGNGHFALLHSIAHKRKGIPQAEAYEAVGFKKDARDFRSAAEILKELKVHSIQMITNNVNKVETLTQHGILVSGTVPTTL